MKIHLIRNILKILSNDIEEKLKQKKILLDSIQALTNKQTALNDERKREMESDHSLIQTIYNEHSYFEDVKNKLEALGFQIQDLNNKIDAMNEEIIELYKEQRKFELLLEKQLSIIRQKEAVAESKFFDELGLRRSKD
jgi:flagellar biosynthesis chaperone FliJ